METKMQKIPYMPLTAAPFRKNEKYRETAPHHPELRKYIRCFWGSDVFYTKKEEDAGIVVPDTCVDIIYWVDYTANKISGGFCGINDVSFSETDKTMEGHLVSVFAIRFYAWEACAFAEDSLKGTLNGHYDVRSRFRWLDELLRPLLFEKETLRERINITEALFLRRLAGVKTTAYRQIANTQFSSAQSSSVRYTSTQSASVQSVPMKPESVQSAVALILLYKGALTTEQLAKECFISCRQLERLFHEYIGITPKKLANLVRYQSVWREVLENPAFQVQDAVWKYGYADQSHLMREFKRYHGMDMRTARKYAYHVGNIQYPSSIS